MGINEDDPDARVEKFDLKIVDRWVENGWDDMHEEGAMKEIDGWRYDKDWVFDHYAAEDAPAKEEGMSGRWIRSLRRE